MSGGMGHDRLLLFVGELAKFNVFPKADALLCLKVGIVTQSCFQSQ